MLPSTVCDAGAASLLCDAPTSTFCTKIATNCLRLWFVTIDLDVCFRRLVHCLLHELSNLLLVIRKALLNFFGTFDLAINRVFLHVNLGFVLLCWWLLLTALLALLILLHNLLEIILQVLLLLLNIRIALL